MAGGFNGILNYFFRKQVKLPTSTNKGVRLDTKPGEDTEVLHEDRHCEWCLWCRCLFYQWGFTQLCAPGAGWSMSAIIKQSCILYSSILWSPSVTLIRQSHQVDYPVYYRGSQFFNSGGPAVKRWCGGADNTAGKCNGFHILFKSIRSIRLKSLYLNIKFTL